MKNTRLLANIFKIHTLFNSEWCIFNLLENNSIIAWVLFFHKMNINISRFSDDDQLFKKYDKAKFLRIAVFENWVLTRPERWWMLFSQSPLISQLCLHYFEKQKNKNREIENSFPAVFLSGLHLKNCYPVSILVICTFATKHRLVTIILCVSFC